MNLQNKTIRLFSRLLLGFAMAAALLSPACLVRTKAAGISQAPSTSKLYSSETNNPDGTKTYTYTTEGAGWTPVVLKTTSSSSSWEKAPAGTKSDTYALMDPKTGRILKEANGTPSVLLTMNGSQWTFTFATAANGDYSYFVRESMKGDMGKQYTVVDKDGNPISYITVENGKGLLVNRKNISYGSLSLSKNVVLEDGAASDPDQQFRFDIALTGSDAYAGYLTGERTFGTVSFVNGKGVVYLKDGQSVTFDNLPDGIGYTISESAASGYSTDWSLTDNHDGKQGSGTAVSDTIEKDVTDAVAFTNTKKASPINPPEPGKTGNVTVSKKVITDEAQSPSFSFRASFTGLAPNQSYQWTSNEESAVFEATASGSADLDFTLSDGQSAVFENLPVGCTWQMMENAAPGYIASFEITGSNLVSVQAAGSSSQADTSLATAAEVLDENEEANTIFTNRQESYGLVSVDVTKQWMDENNRYGVRPDELTIYLYRSLDPDADLADWDIADTLVLKPAEGDESSSLWSGSFKNLPASDENGQKYYYQVQEQTGLDAHYQSSIKDTSNPDTPKVYSYEISNTYTVSVLLPETGQAGIGLVTAGAILIAGVSAWKISRKRKE